MPISGQVQNSHREKSEKKLRGAAKHATENMDPERKVCTYYGRGRSRYDDDVRLGIRSPDQKSLGGIIKQCW
jgi:hypothetical protein